MKFIFTLITFTFAINLSAQFYLDLSPQECFDLIQENSDNDRFTILDVRTKGEYDPEHIEDAYNRDFYAADFREQLDSLDKSRVYLLYCRSGNRSGQTLDLAEELAFDTVFNMIGGITQWNLDGYPVTDVVPVFDPNLYSSNSSSTSNLELANLEMFPNPTSGVVNVISESNREMSVIAYDYLGNVNSTLTLNDGRIDLSTSKAGLYYISIYENNELVGIRRVVKI